jgi:hypothetical protein
MSTNSGTTHIKTIFSLLPGIGKYFIGNAHCSSDEFVMQLIHMFQFFTINIHKKFRESSLENKRTGERIPLFLTSDQEIPGPERHEHDGRNGVVLHLSGKLFLRFWTGSFLFDGDS